MKNCIECNHKFTFYDRLKVYTNFRGYMKCPQCNSVYKAGVTVYRALYYFLLLNICWLGLRYLTFINFPLRAKLYMLTLIIGMLLFDFIPHRWHRYKKVD